MARSHAIKTPNPPRVSRSPWQPTKIVPFHAVLPKEQVPSFMAWPSFLFEKMLNPWQDVRPPLSWMDSWQPEGKQPFLKAQSRETDQACFYSIELPDVRRNQIALSVQNGALMLKVEDTQLKETKGRRARYLRHAFSLPFYTNAAAITAQLQNGILTIIMPKTAKPATARPHVITIKEKEEV